MSAGEWLRTVGGLTALVGCVGFALYFYGLAVMVVFDRRRRRGLPRSIAWAILAAPWIILAAFVL
jgi:hypothetical protein